MVDAQHPLHHCLRCRHSTQFGAGSSEPILWCRLNEATCKAACPGYERYPGADRADSECEHELAEALRQRKPAGPAATGACLYCGEALEEGRRWCSRECEAGWEYVQERRAMNRGKG